MTNVHLSIGFDRGVLIRGDQELKVNLQFPKYNYSFTDRSRLFFNRFQAGDLLTEQLIDPKSGDHVIPLNNVIPTGRDLNYFYAFYRHHSMKLLLSSKLESYTSEVDFKLSRVSGETIKSESLEIITGFVAKPFVSTKTFMTADRAFREKYGILDNVNGSVLLRQQKVLSRSMFFVNAKAYREVLEEIKATNPGLTNDIFLLQLIELFVNPRAAKVELSDVLFGRNQATANRILDALGVTEKKQLLDHVFRQSDRLFGFPIHVSKGTVVSGSRKKVAGSIRFKDVDNLLEKDLPFYKLCVEYEFRGGVKRVEYDWDKNNAEIVGNTVNFSFNDEDMEVDESVSALSMSLEGFNGKKLWETSRKVDHPKWGNIKIDVNDFRPERIGPDNIINLPDFALKLRGKVLKGNTNHRVNDLTVIIRAKEGATSQWKIVSSATTDSSGNFSFDYPYGEFSEAQALVSVVPDSPADLAIVKAANRNVTISKDFIYLLLEGEGVREEECECEGDDCGCGCGKGKDVRRIPDDVDLVESDDYSQDIGGNCVNLSTPNRTLQEYNFNAIVRISDPDVANYRMIKKESNGSTQYNMVPARGRVKRQEIGIDNPVKWNEFQVKDYNNIYTQAVSVATGHILHYKSVFKADGYSLGELTYSLPLAPGQKKSIVVLESNHELKGREAQNRREREALSADLFSDRFITDQLAGSIDESLSGRSRASNSGVSAGLGVGFSGVSLGVSGGHSSSKSSASQNSGRNISQFFGEKLKQSLTQNADSYRNLNASVVTTVSQDDEYSVNSEVVANHNHCHSVTFMYFEVLRHYAVFQELSHVEECVFVPLVMTEFTSQNIHRWKDVLAPNLLPIRSSTYLKFNAFRFRFQHPLLKAFDANDRVESNWSRVDFPGDGESYADGSIMNMKGFFNLKINFKRPKTRYDRILSLPVGMRIKKHRVKDTDRTLNQGIISAVIGGIFGGIIKYRTVEEEIDFKMKIFDAFMRMDENYDEVPPARSIRIMNFQPQEVTLSGEEDEQNITTTGDAFFENDVASKKEWEAYSRILGYDNVFDFLDFYFKGSLIAEWDFIFNRDILPSVFNKLVESLDLSHAQQEGNVSFNLDFSAQRPYNGGNRSISVSCQSVGPVGIKRSELPLYLNLSIDDVDFRLLQNNSQLTVRRVSLDYETEHFQGSLYRGSVKNDLMDQEGVNLYIPLTSRDKINPRKEDRFLMSELLEHLNNNLEHYNKVLWKNLDPDRRYAMLDGFNIEIYDKSGRPTGRRSLASVVKNDLITITGNSLVFPVASGYRVNQSFIVEEESNLDFEQVLKEHYMPLTPVPPYRLSVPSRGVYMESVMGDCDACEMVKENSSQDWDKFKTEDVTPITPIVTPTPSVQPYNPDYQGFSNPMINIQAAPNAPAPAAGLSKQTDLLGKSDIFKDITGLAATQKNAMDTYLSNQSNAKAFAEMASNLSLQQHNTKNSDKILEKLDKAKKSGAISDADHKELTKAHLNHQIDGGESMRKSAEDKDSLTKAAVKAAGQGQAVKAEKVDDTGVVEKVEIEGNGGIRESFDFTVANFEGIELLQQPSPNSCWATVFTMLQSWKHGEILEIEEALVNYAGLGYVELFEEDNGLFQSDKVTFLNDSGLSAMTPSNLAPIDYLNLLKEKGLLWVTTDEDESDKFSIHARILYGMYGDGSVESTRLRFVDPILGITVDESFEDFIEKYESPAAAGHLLQQIVFFDEVPDLSEGGASYFYMTIHDKFSKHRGIKGVDIKITKPDGSVVEKTSNKYGAITMRSGDLKQDGEYTIEIPSSLDPTVENIVDIPEGDTAVFKGETHKFEVKSKKVTASPANWKSSTKSNVVTWRIPLIPHWLKSKNIGSRGGKSIKYLMLHSAGDMGSALNTFLPKKASGGTSTHYLIDRDGLLLKIVDDDKKAIHAGTSFWNGDTSLNALSIGIDLVEDSSAAQNSYTAAQYETLLKLVKKLTDKHSIPKKNIVGHSDIAVIPGGSRLGNRRRDPDRFFDWEKLSAAGYAKIIVQANNPNMSIIYEGIFGTIIDLELRKGDKDSTARYGGKVRNAFKDKAIIETLQTHLSDIGYKITINGNYDDATKYAVRSFQLRLFTSSRKAELADGAEDQGRINSATAKYIFKCRQ